MDRVRTEQKLGKRSWSKPELTKLGTIKDVAGPSGTGAQASGGGQNRS